MKLKELNQRYKKLKQSDRMEYLAIDSVYQNKGSSLSTILFLSISIKIFILLMILFSLFSAVNIVADIKGVERMQISDFGEGYFNQTLGEFLGAILIAFSLMFLDIGVLLLLGILSKQRNKTLDEFLTERKL